MEVKIWILGGVVVAMGGLLSFVLKFTAEKMVGKMDEMLKELQHLNITAAMHGQDIRNLQESDAQLHQRLNGHADRLRHIEKNIRPHGHVET